MNIASTQYYRQSVRCTLILVIASMCWLTISSAQARLSTRNYTCSDVKDLVFQQGAIVLNTKNSSVYRRFVADRSFCKRDEVVRRINVPTKSEKCRLQQCVPNNRMDNN